MSTPLEVATRGLEQAQESLREAQQELKDWKAIFFEDKTKTKELVAAYRNDTETIKLEAQVNRCDAAVARAQKTFNNLTSNRGNCN